MVDLASIRNASFTLTPTGYNPEEVDQFLADLADQLSELPAPAAAPEPVVTQIPIEQPVAEVQVEQQVEQMLAEPTERPTADLGGLQNAVERTIARWTRSCRTSWPRSRPRRPSRSRRSTPSASGCCRRPVTRPPATSTRRAPG